MKFILSILFLSPGALANPLAPSLETLKAKVRHIQKIEVDRLFSERTKEGFWHYPPQMGSLYSGQYWLIAQWLGLDIPNFDKTKFISIVLKDQLANGSWFYLPDETVTEEGQVGVTVMNYWALKAMGVSKDHPQMVLARKWILAHGGMEASNNSVKFMLPCFGNLAWSAFPVPPEIPLISPKTVIGLVSPSVGRWMKSFIPPVAYLASVKATRILGGNFQIPELLKNPALAFKTETIPNPPIQHPDLALSIFKLHRPFAGSWGGTTIASLLSMMALRHAETYLPHMKIPFEDRIQKAMGFVNKLQLGTEVSAYRGAVFDSRYWDSVLIGNALMEAGVPAAQLKMTADYVHRYINTRTGGMAFGADYEPDPDTDDTAEMILFFRRGHFYPDAVTQGIRWLYKMQNDEDQSDGTPGRGGWGAYDRNNNGYFPIKQITDDYRDSTWIFDPATPDVAGHILEALGATGFRVNEVGPSPMLIRAVEYLKRSQQDNGTWFGRWGVNSIYGTSSVLVGLRAVGLSVSDPMIQNGLSWIKACQKLNGDGGFGESFLTYQHPELGCHDSVSSPTQTAWAVFSYLATEDEHSIHTLRAIEYLIQSYDENTGWSDNLINGTGHPVVVPIFYPSYARVFPLQALSRWLQQMEQSDRMPKPKTK